MSKNISAVIICISLLFSSGAFAGNDQTTDVESVISEGRFQPTVPDDIAIVKKYGPGSVLETNGVLYRTYRDKKLHVWVQMAVDTDPVPNERFVSEVLVGSVPMPKAARKAKFSNRISSLRGIALGSDAGALAALGEEGETSTTKINGQSYIVKRYRPVQSDLSLYNDFYILGGKVMAFSVGMTE